METMRIAWFNWKCIKHPEAGGAEVFTHEVARRIAGMGHEVTLITSRPKGLPLREEVDGYTVLRSGNKFTVYLNAKKLYEKYLENRVDVIIDETNTLPFFTIIYVREPVIALIHQLAREYWFLETKPPLSIIGYLMEPQYLKLYKNVPTVTVSNSTKEDLERLGFKKIHVVPEGLSIKPLNELPDKEEDPTIIFLGRLRKIKRPDHVVKAFIEVVREEPQSKLWIVGDGPLRRRLEKTVEKNGLSSNVVFHGRVGDEEKVRLLRKAHVLVLPGVREGWGLVVIEAYSQGTPAIAYDVPGLRDSVRHLKTGILVPQGNIRLLAKSMIYVLQNNKLREKLAREALEWSKQFDWNNTAMELLKVIKTYI